MDLSSEIYFFSLVRHKDQELIQSGPEVIFFFSCSAEIVLKLYHWIIFRPQNQMGNLPVRHTVMKQLETTLIQRLDVDLTLDGILGSTLCAWLAGSFCSQTSPLMLNFKLTSSQIFFTAPINHVQTQTYNLWFKLLSNKNLQIYLHHRIARLYFSIFIYFIFLFIIIVIFDLFFGLPGWTVYTPKHMI